MNYKEMMNMISGASAPSSQAPSSTQPEIVDPVTGRKFRLGAPIFQELSNTQAYARALAEYNRQMEQQGQYTPPMQSGATQYTPPVQPGPIQYTPPEKRSSFVPPRQMLFPSPPKLGTSTFQSPTKYIPPSGRRNF